MEKKCLHVCIFSVSDEGGCLECEEVRRGGVFLGKIDNAEPCSIEEKKNCLNTVIELAKRELGKLCVKKRGE